MRNMAVAVALAVAACGGGGGGGAKEESYYYCGFVYFDESLGAGADLWMPGLTFYTIGDEVTRIVSDDGQETDDLATIAHWYDVWETAVPGPNPCTDEPPLPRWRWDYRAGLPVWDE